MNKRIRKEEIKVCEYCKGTGHIKIRSCSCTSCETNTTCKECGGKGVIKIVRFEDVKEK